MAPKPSPAPSWPAGLEPMLLQTASRPFDREGWLFELKYDGYRLMAMLQHGAVRLRTRGGADATSWFPEIVRGLASVSEGPHIIDGEVCVLDSLGRSDFDLLHARARARRWREGLAPVVYCCFDLLMLNGRQVIDWPLARRKQALGHLLESKPAAVLPVSHVETEGLWLYEQAVSLQLEGIVAKRMDAAYSPGQRTADWLKMKRPGATPAQRWQRKPKAAQA